jgi:hypothetical protein
VLDNFSAQLIHDEEIIQNFGILKKMNLAFSNNQDQIIDENRSTSQTEFY